MKYKCQDSDCEKIHEEKNILILRIPEYSTKPDGTIYKNGLYRSVPKCPKCRGNVKPL
jgi:hypothetical protein